MTYETELSNDIKKTIFKSIRSKVLRNLVFLYMVLILDYPHSKIAMNAFRRAKKKEPHLRLDKGNVLFSLKPEDIMPIIEVSRRTAIEYIQALRLLCGL